MSKPELLDHPYYTSQRRRRVRPPRSVAGACGWAIAGALVGGLAGGASVAVLRYVLKTDVCDLYLTTQVLTRLGLVAAAGIFVGALVGTGSGIFNDRSAGRVAWGAFWGAGIGFVGGYSPSLAVIVLAGILPPSVSVILAGAALGLVTALTAYLWGRDWIELPGDYEEESFDLYTPTAIPRLRPSVGWIMRLLPVGVVSVGCLLAAAFLPTSPVGWAVLAVGLLGLAVVWALAGQERRIRELEKTLRDNRGRQGNPRVAGEVTN